MTVRTKEIWDDWMFYDDDGFHKGIRSDAPDEVKEAYNKYLSDVKKQSKGGMMPK